MFLGSGIRCGQQRWGGGCRRRSPPRGQEGNDHGNPHRDDRRHRELRPLPLYADTNRPLTLSRPPCTQPPDRTGGCAHHVGPSCSAATPDPTTSPTADTSARRPEHTCACVAQQPGPWPQRAGPTIVAASNNLLQRCGVEALSPVSRHDLELVVEPRHRGVGVGVTRAVVMTTRGQRGSPT
jgi:hypothetical protein